MAKLLYIGKSDKNFTHKRMYNYHGWSYDDSISITVRDNKNMDIFLNNEYFDYFYDNFKILNEHDIKQLERKNKLNKISKKCQ